VRSEADDCINDFLRRSVIDGELAHSDIRILANEHGHVRRGRTAKAIDGLPGVADDPEASTVAGDSTQKPATSAVHVLVFVDQHVSMP
jgi:hypothetical protein